MKTRTKCSVRGWTSINFETFRIVLNKVIKSGVCVFSGWLWIALKVERRSQTIFKFFSYALKKRKKEISSRHGCESWRAIQGDLQSGASGKSQWIGWFDRRSGWEIILRESLGTLKILGMAEWSWDCETERSQLKVKKLIAWFGD